MKACINEEYGSPDVLHFSEVETPTPKHNEIRIKIHAVSINGSDSEGVSGKPLYSRIGGLFKPKNTIRGSDIAGVVDAVGETHTEFNLGDEVFGELLDYHGGFAEYACSDGQTLAHKPASLSFEQAAAIPQAGVIAYNGICKQEQAKLGQKVLINGAGGSGGSFAIQLAKLNGAEVTAVDASEKLAFMRELGAAYALDYNKDDFTKHSHHYDLILDLNAHRAAWHYPRALRKGGSYAVVGGSVSTLLQVLLFSPFTKLFKRKSMRVLAVPQNRADLLSITELVTSGMVEPFIDRTFSFERIIDAMHYVANGESKGKVVIKLV